MYKQCECIETGFCERYKKFMTPHKVHLCQTNEAYRILFETQMKHHTCEHFDTYTGENKVFKQCCGARDIKLKIFNCDVHGKCTMTGKLEGIKSCAHCSDFKCMECDYSKGDTCPNCGTKLENFDPSIPVTRECYSQAPDNMLFHADGTQARLKNLYCEPKYGSACFYIGGGPSLLKQDLTLLNERPISTFAVNNVAAKIVRPTFWCGADEPKSFHNSIWQDPTITKFVPTTKSHKHFYFKTGTKLVNSGYVAAQAPNVYQFNMLGKFDHKTYLTEPGFTWGCDKGVKDSIGIASGRSVMFIAMKMMFYLGFSRVYLLGCDFNMQHDESGNGKGKTYAFSQYKHKGGCNTNNDCYEIMNKRFMALRPTFEKNNFQVMNCTPDSNLHVFDHMDFEEAINKEKLQDSVNVSNMY
jgi:hypothetical protein